MVDYNVVFMYNRSDPVEPDPDLINFAKLSLSHKGSVDEIRWQTLLSMLKYFKQNNIRNEVYERLVECLNIIVGEDTVDYIISGR